MCRLHETEKQNLNSMIVLAVEPRGDALYLAVKRIFDMVMALCAGVVLLIHMALVAVLIKLDSRAPALKRMEDRLGQESIL